MPQVGVEKIEEYESIDRYGASQGRRWINDGLTGGFRATADVLKRSIMNGDLSDARTARRRGSVRQGLAGIFFSAAAQRNERNHERTQGDQGRRKKCQ